MKKVLLALLSVLTFWILLEGASRVYEEVTEAAAQPLPELGTH